MVKESFQVIDSAKVGRVQGALDKHGDLYPQSRNAMIAGLIGLTISNPEFAPDGDTVYKLPYQIDVMPEDGLVTCDELAFIIVGTYPEHYALRNRDLNLIPSYDPTRPNSPRSPRVALAELLQANKNEEQVNANSRIAGNDFVISLLRMGLLKQWYDNNSAETDGIYAGLYHAVKVIVLNALTGIKTGLYPDSIEEIFRLREARKIDITDQELEDHSV